VSVVESPPVAWLARGTTAGGVTLELVAFAPVQAVPASGSLGGQLRVGRAESAVWDGRIFGLLEEGRRNVTFSTRVFAAGESSFADLLLARVRERAPSALQIGAVLDAAFYPPMTAVAIARWHQGLRDLRRQDMPAAVRQKSERQVMNEVGRLARAEGESAALSVAACAAWISAGQRIVATRDAQGGIGPRSPSNQGMKP
jgi:hypothetical protein